MDAQILERHPLGVHPQAVQIVVAPHGFIEDVDEDIAQVDEDPSALPQTLYAQGLHPEFNLQCIENPVGDGLDLARVGPVTENEPIAKRGLTFDVQDGQLVGFGFKSGFCGQPYDSA